MELHSRRPACGSARQSTDDLTSGCCGSRRSENFRSSCASHRTGGDHELARKRATLRETDDLHPPVTLEPGARPRPVGASRVHPLGQIILIVILTVASAAKLSHQFQLHPSSSSPASRRFDATPLSPHFGSSRYIYPPVGRPSRRRSDSAADDAESSFRIDSIQSQLLELRRQLESALASAKTKRQVALGSPCLSSADCSAHIDRSHCRSDSLTCGCLPQHVELNATTCLPPSLLGFECSLDGQCQQRVPNSRCAAGRCSCAPHFVAHRRDKCLSASKLADYCLSDKQCQLSDAHSYCKWKIPQVYGLCKCPPNYALLRVAAADGSGPTPANVSKCIPRLGDTCLSDGECQLSTRNSLCLEDIELTGASLGPAAKGARWHTSDAGKRRCHCAKGFSESPDRLACVIAEPASFEGEPASTPAGAELHLSAASAMDAKHHYDLVITAPGGTRRPEVGGEPAPRTRTRTSSLGKSCSERRECQARDPHSDCIGGVCECLRPTSRCSAAKTGCHADTFQCRSGQCISWYFVCDQFKNCADGSDEDGCLGAGAGAGSCPPEAFACGSGECVARAKLCDGKRDCRDNSDELRCGRPAANSSLAGPQQPPDQVGGPGGCHPRAFACADGQCLPGYVFCNAVADCADGSDELESVCERAGPESDRLLRGSLVTQAPGDSPLVRADRRAIDRMLAALGLAGARRSRRTGAPAHPDGECPSSAFSCANGKCRSSAVLCSGVDGCGDNSDEANCEVCRCEAP